MGKGVKYALAPSSNPIRRRLDPLLGRLLLSLRPGRALALARGEGLARISGVDRMMIAALVARHERAGTLGDLAGLHRSMWAGEEGLKFHAQAEKRFQSWWAGNLSAIVDPIRDAIGASGGGIHTLCEIGCGSGLVVADLPERLPEIRAFVGLDLSPDQIARNRARFADARFRFETGDAAQWIPQHAGPGWVYLTNSGVLEYLGERELAALFARVAQSWRPSVFALIEPIADNYDLARETASRPYNFEKSLGHNYPLLLTAAGWRVQHQEERRIDGTRMLMVVASAF